MKSSETKQTITITLGQVKQIAKRASVRFKFYNHGTWFNCIDTQTGQNSSEGGDYNFASYNFKNFVEHEYLQMIGEDALYFDWFTVGVSVSEERKSYVLKIKNKVINLLCGYEHQTTYT